MFDTVKKAFQIKEIRLRILFTLAMLIVIRFGSQLPVPGVDREYFSRWFESQQTGDAFSLFDAFTGGSFLNMSVLALNITPYITSSIIMQLLTIAIPALERLQKSGQEGQKRIAQITRYVTVGLALFQAIGLVASVGVIKPGWYNYMLVGISMAGGSALAMWIGERITEKGIGNGISLLITAGIVSNLFNGVVSLTGKALGANSLTPWLTLFAVIVVALLMTTIITWADMGVRRINVHFAKRVTGRKMYGGQNSVIPLKVIAVGVLPLIFAYSFMTFPSTLIQLTGGTSTGFGQWWARYMYSTSP